MGAGDSTCLSHQKPHQPLCVIAVLFVYPFSVIQNLFTLSLTVLMVCWITFIHDIIQLPFTPSRIPDQQNCKFYGTFSLVSKDHSNHMSNNSLTSNVHQITMDLTVLDMESISMKSIDHPWLIMQDGSDTVVSGTVPTYF